MMKLFTRSFLLLLLLGILRSEKLLAQLPSVYETVSSGNWDDVNVWRSWSSGVIGVGTSVSPITATAGPTGTQKVVIHSGHTISLDGKNRSCYGLVVENGGVLWVGSSSPFRLQLATGGTGFPYPVSDTVQNDGVIGGVGDGIFFEPGTNAANITLTGTGTYAIEKIRFPGGIGSTAGGIVNMIIDANINLYQSANYALSLVDNPTLTDNYTVTINAGKTVTTMDPSGFFHNSQNVGTYGNYTYHIKGTLNLSANTQTSSNVSAKILVPTPATSTITVNVDGGVLKLGSAFKADTSMTTPLVSAGILTLETTNGGLIDAENTTSLNLGKTTDGAGGLNDLFFGLDPSGKLKQVVGAAEVKFPIGLNTSVTSNDAYLTNTGTSDTFTVGVKNTFDFPLADPTKVVNRQWDIQEATTGSANVNVRLGWLIADQQSNFNPSAPINTIHYQGSWNETSAAITGSGTVADPYISSTAGYTSFSPFGVDNTGGVVPVTFVNIKASQDANNTIQVGWANATEFNINRYVIERSSDGINFSPATMVSPKENNGLYNSYTWTDVAPFNGNNFYRIKAVEQSSTINYSTIVKVDIGSANSGIAIYPNPVTNGTVNLQLTNMPQGAYEAKLMNLNGQVLVTKTINHAGGSATQTIQLNNSVAKGIFTLEIINPDKTKTSFKVMAE
jgi:hypothetical protein